MYQYILLMRVKVYIFLCIYLEAMINWDNVLGYQVKLYSGQAVLSWKNVGDGVTAQQISVFKHKICFPIMLSYYNNRIAAIEL